MKAPQDIILRPIITENSMEGMQNRKFTFKVAKDANKIEIKKACEALFGVDVESVNTISVKGKYKRQGRAEGFKPDWKKAIVTLTEKSKSIEFFDGIM